MRQSSHEMLSGRIAVACRTRSQKSCGSPGLVSTGRAGRVSPTSLSVIRSRHTHSTTGCGNSKGVGRQTSLECGPKWVSMAVKLATTTVAPWWAVPPLKCGLGSTPRLASQDAEDPVLSDIQVNQVYLA